MATKIDRASRSASPADHADDAKAARELAILHPEKDVLIGDKLITVREYGFIEGAKVLSIAKPFIDALYATAGRAGPMPSFVEVEQLFIDHQECVVALMAKAADVEVTWIEGLNDKDGSLLLQTWWMVNSNFFIRRVITRLAADRALERLVGAGSTQRSSDTDTAAVSPTSESLLPVS